MKLGELLVSAGKLTPAQVEEALKGQAIFGGRFGTNLIEMGYLDEHDLAHFLSKKAGVPHAAPEQLMDIPPQVLKIIPEQVVRKYRVVPIALNNRKLILAMADPSDFAAIDEISFQTGYIVFPVIVPELRLVAAMEKHYNIRRELRYIKVDGGGRSKGRLVATPDSIAAEQARQPAPPAAPAPTMAPPPAAPPTMAAPPAAPPARSPIQPDDDVIELPLLSEVQSFEAPEPDPFGLDMMQGRATLQAPKDLTLDDVALGLTRADDRHSIAELVVKYAGQQFNRAAMFLLKNGKATGWAAVSGRKELPSFEKLEIPLNEPSILAVIAHTKTHYAGPMPITPANQRFLAALGIGTPANNLLVPLMMMGRVVAILYLEGGPVRLDEKIPEITKLMGKASIALEILILKNKILAP